jgi:hypothetical protein
MTILDDPMAPKKLTEKEHGDVFFVSCPESNAPADPVNRGTDRHVV